MVGAVNSKMYETVKTDGAKFIGWAGVKTGENSGKTTLLATLNGKVYAYGANGQKEEVKGVTGSNDEEIKKSAHDIEVKNLEESIKNPESKASIFKVTDLADFGELSQSTKAKINAANGSGDNIPDTGKTINPDTETVPTAVKPQTPSTPKPAVATPKPNTKPTANSTTPQKTDTASSGELSEAPKSDEPVYAMIQADEKGGVLGAEVYYNKANNKQYIYGAKGSNSSVIEVTGMNGKQIIQAIKSACSNGSLKLFNIPKDYKMPAPKTDSTGRFDTSKITVEPPVITPD